MLGLGQSPRRSAHDPSPSPISTSLKTQATYPPSVRERARKYPTAVAPPISRRSPRDSPIGRATSSRLSPAARRRARAPASRSATKRTIGSECAASIAAASVIGSLIGHSARRGQQQQPKNFASDYPGRAPCAPMLHALPEGPAASAGQRQGDQRACRSASDCCAGIVIEGKCAVPVTRIGRPLPRYNKPSNERLDLCCRVSIC